MEQGQITSHLLQRPEEGFGGWVGGMSIGAKTLHLPHSRSCEVAQATTVTPHTCRDISLGTKKRQWKNFTCETEQFYTKEVNLKF